MLAHDDQLSELWQSLNRLQSMPEAEKELVRWLEERYGRGCVALDRSFRGVRRITPTRLDQVSAQMVAAGLYPRECPVVMNEFFIVECEGRPLGEYDVDLLEKVTELYRQSLPRLYRAEGRDLLTGLLGPERFPDELHRVVESKRQASLLLLDIDRFSEYNAAFGEAEGDRMMLEVAGLMAEKTRPNDTLFRLNGDEFAVLLPGTPIEAAGSIAERIRQAFCDRFGADNFPLTASIGVASWPDRATSKDELLKRAKDAMFNSWRIGGDRVCLCPAREKPEGASPGG